MVHTENRGGREIIQGLIEPLEWEALNRDSVYKHRPIIESGIEPN